MTDYNGCNPDNQSTARKLNQQNLTLQTNEYACQSTIRIKPTKKIENDTTRKADMIKNLTTDQTIHKQQLQNASPGISAYQSEHTLDRALTISFLADRFSPSSSCRSAQ